jgi:hypothetical protein
MSDAISQARSLLSGVMFGDTLTILRPRVIDDGGGSQAPDPAGPQEIGPILGNWQARPVADVEAQTADTTVVSGRYVFRCAVDVDIRATDVVRYQGVVYAVVDCPPVAARSLTRQVGLTEAR